MGSSTLLAQDTFFFLAQITSWSIWLMTSFTFRPRSQLRLLPCSFFLFLVQVWDLCLVLEESRNQGVQPVAKEHGTKIWIVFWIDFPCFIGEVKLYASYVELLGNNLSDLLSPGGRKLEVMEDKFGKVRRLLILFLFVVSSLRLCRVEFVSKF
jgi:hypothetical protein